MSLAGRLASTDGRVERLAAIEADEVGDEADLRRCPVAVGAIHLPVDVAGVDEQHGVGAFCFRLALVEEPQRARQRDGVEHVGADGDHDIHRPRFDQLLPQFLLGGAGIGRRVGHDEAGAAGGC
jgi:hypothetical protein